MNNNNQEANLGGRIIAPEPEPEPRPWKQNLPFNNSKKKIITGVATGLVVLIVGAVVVLATGIWNPVWNPFQPSPDKILEQAFENMSDLKAVHSKMIFDMDVQAEESFSMRMVIESDSDAIDKDSPKSQAEIDVSIFTGGVEMLFGGEARSIDDIAYFKLDTVPFLFSAQLIMFGINLDDWTGKWFRFDSKELGMSFGKTLYDEEELGMGERIKQLLLEYPIAKVEKKLAAEKIEGQNTYHYLLALDQENLKQFYIELIEILKEYYSLADLGNMTEVNEQEISDEIDELFEKTGERDFEIWIGKKDKLVYKIAGQKRFDLSVIEETGEGIIDSSFDISFSNFNQPVDITAPEESDSIIEMLMSFLQIFMGDATNRAKDARIKSAVNQVRTQAELLWVDSPGGSYKELCYYGSFNVNHPDYGSNLRALSNDIMAQGSSVNCYSSKDEYCVSASLLGGGFFCVDSTGQVQETTGSQNPCTLRAKCSY